MNYKLKKIGYGVGTADEIFEYGVDFDSLTDETWALNGINWWGWTVEEIQKIIDKSKNLVKDEMYKYQVEGSDLVIYIYSDEVYFFDAYSEQEVADLIWSFEKFIDFMEQFKAFVAENS